MLARTMAKAEDIARNVDAVKSVVNNLVLKP
jgi:hypothetical protein